MTYNRPRMVLRWVLEAASPDVHAKTCAHDVGHVGYLIVMANMANMAIDRPATGDRLSAWHGDSVGTANIANTARPGNPCQFA